MNIALTRVDSRLVHGQITSSWVPATGATMIVVANDALAGDAWRWSFMKSTSSTEVALQVSRIDGLAGMLEGYRRSPGTAIVLFESVQDALSAFEAGATFTQLNLGNVHAHPGSRAVSSSVYLNDDDIAALRKLEHRGVAIEIRAVSREKPVPASSFLR